MSVYFTSNDIPFWTTPMVGALPCRIPVIPGGDEAATRPLAERTDKCSHPAYLLIGTGAVCAHHAREFFRLAGATLRDPLVECVA